MTDRSQSVQVEAFEHVLAAPGIALLRVRAARSRRRNSVSRPILVIEDDGTIHRFAPLPAPDDPRGVLRVAYSVPVELLEHEVTFALEFKTGGPLTLPEPSAGSMRLAAHGSRQDPRQSGTVQSEPDPDLDQDRRTNIQEKLVQQSKALAESERAATARDRLQRRALYKLRAELEQHQEDEQRASTRMHELDTWRQELERRLADVTSELAATKHAFEESDSECRRLDGALAESDAAQAHAQSTMAILRRELEDARRHAARSDDLEREVEASRGEADRLQTAVVRLESEIRSIGHGPADSMRNGSDRELAAVSSALDGAREEMNALRQELETAQASERRANLELVMLTAETQARLQAQTELKQAARESGPT